MSRSSSYSSNASLSSDDEYYGDNGEEFRNNVLNNRYCLIENEWNKIVQKSHVLIHLYSLFLFQYFQHRNSLTC